MWGLTVIVWRGCDQTANWNQKCQIEMPNWTAKLNCQIELPNWNQNVKLKCQIELPNWTAKVNFQIETKMLNWNAKLNCDVNDDCQLRSNCQNLPIETRWSKKKKSQIVNRLPKSFSLEVECERIYQLCINIIEFYPNVNQRAT